MQAFFEIHNRAHNATGVWGPVDAIHQFCEPHYATTVYLAECYNAVSSLWYVYLACTLQQKRQQHRQGWILPALAGWLGLIGIGSFLFHGTMRRSMQWLDEGPMMGSIGTALWWKLGIHAFTKDRVVVWRACAVALTVGILLLYVVIDSYELFVHGFTGMVLLDAVLGFTLDRGDKRLLHRSVVIILVAKLFWEMENKWCEMYPAVWMAHVVWHVTSGWAAYYGVLYNVSLEHDDKKQQ